MIITEGTDDRNLLVSFLNDLAQNKQIKKEDFKNLIEPMGGKTNLLNPLKYEKIKTKIETKEIDKVLFIFDSDFEKDNKNCNGLEKSEECFNNLKNELNLEIEIDCYIFHRNLDYFLLTTIDESKCYENFSELNDCLDLESIKPNKKPIANMYRDLYPYPKFDFKHKNFDTLKQKLQNLFN